jgi:ABC-type branched-subunit amino acid transport system substrate-binding protein
LLTVGQTVDEAAYRHIIMERTCQAQLLAEAAAANGIKKKIICDEDAKYTADALQEPVTSVKVAINILGESIFRFSDRIQSPCGGNRR